MKPTITTIPAREVASFTDLMTGETVEDVELVPVTITIDGKASENLYFSPTSLDAVRALAAEDGETFRAMFTPVKSANGGSRVAKSYAGNAHAWEVRTATAPHGLSDAASGGTIKNEAAAKFAEFVNAGTWTVIGSKSKPEDGTDAAKTLAANLAATKPAPAKR